MSTSYNLRLFEDSKGNFTLGFLMKAVKSNSEKNTWIWKKAGKKEFLKKLNSAFVELNKE